ncbi:uncharacterized protein PpBr36_10615 [Pyricularia pennisetigena]|uniref:uncharacterized protein n=1 Tax=Pyricularia pennisetigena TaxID=1578925 RepID=UPI001153D768|nr:uncharacterized protein PpBr36_10615 [Pyricularia pennisetigena]TLS21274.1 hypothetical protein PpBr36_10615 [Pyricularia pennisetigena]
MKVIKIQPGGKATVVNAPMPKMDAHCVVVKTAAVALNPVDWKHISCVPGTAGCTAGSDFAGVVRKVGSGVTTLKVGDRVAGWVHGGNISKPQDGAFAQYIVAREGMMIKIPPGVSFTAAATLGVGVSTVGLGLFHQLGLPLPTQPGVGKLPLLIYGGSTATGTLAIQLAKLAGLEVITTCSPHHFHMVRKLGADAVFDYKEPNVGSEIRKLTENALYHAFDCISTEHSARICADALSEHTTGKEPTYSALLYCEFPRRDVRVVVTVAQTIFGEPFTIPELGPENFPGDVDHFEFGKRFWKLTQTLLAEGKLKAHPADVRGGDLEGVLEGLEELRRGKISGKKLVYTLS